ncbi:MAG: YidC/Oxa1 family membrane protein insertase [Candidatus Woesebacteria bacterium]|jgi:YidC/Oxa1 family membrane protein insertase
MSTLVELFSNLLLMLYSLVGNMGIAIIVFTIAIRSLLIPLTLPSLKSRKKMTKMKPELDKLKKKHKNDKKALQMAQLELYKKYNVNPVAGCLPQILQLLILIVLYKALMSFINNGAVEIDGQVINNSFLWLDLTQPDQRYFLPIFAGISQLFLALMISPGGEVPDIVPNKSRSKKVKKANEKEEDMAEMAAMMQKQMIFVMPVMTALIALRFPSGMALYWITTTVFSIIQQYFVSGLGGLKLYTQRLLARKTD